MKEAENKKKQGDITKRKKETKKKKKGCIKVKRKEGK
jgi:hypothetical protein